jgi:hypothetical protein
MATLKKMTRVGADVRQIARLLQAKAPAGHMLAYITPEEAALLKAQGGSGKPHADTGIPSFEDEGGYGFTADTAYDIGPVTQERSPQDYKYSSDTARFGQGYVNRNAPASEAAPATAPESVSYPSGVFAAPPTSPAQATAVEETPYMPAGAFAAGAFAPPEGGAGLGYTPYTIDTSKPAEEKNIMQRLTEATGMKEDTLARLGLGGVQAILGARTARKAAEQGRVGKAEQQALAQPYQAKGAELQRAAQAGELTPQSQQSLQAVQAQIAQQTANRGGVGAMQSQAQVEAFRQQLLQQQYDYGLKLSGIGDQIALGAIKTGLQADQYVNELTSNYYNNIARSLLPAPAQQVVTRG